MHLVVLACLQMGPGRGSSLGGRSTFWIGAPRIQDGLFSGLLAFFCLMFGFALRYPLENGRFLFLLCHSRVRDLEYVLELELERDREPPRPLRDPEPLLDASSPLRACASAAFASNSVGPTPAKLSKLSSCELGASDTV